MLQLFLGNPVIHFGMLCGLYLQNDKIHDFTRRTKQNFIPITNNTPYVREIIPENELLTGA